MRRKILNICFGATDNKLKYDDSYDKALVLDIQDTLDYDLAKNED